MIAAAKLLGIGIYSPAEAALYARVRTQLISRWIYGTQGTRQTAPVVEPQLGATDDKIVTFLDFVQALAIRRLRNERHIPLQQIRDAYDRARQQFSVEYPFATKGVRIGLFGPFDRPEKQVLFICFEAKDGDADRYFQLTGKKHGNQLISQVALTYAKFLEYDPDTRLACRFTPYKSEDGQVTMDPEIRFGEPFIEATGYTARALFNAYQTEGTAERAAEVYGVEANQIQLAVEFFDYLNPSAAA